MCPPLKRNKKKFKKEFSYLKISFAVWSRDMKSCSYCLIFKWCALLENTSAVLVKPPWTDISWSHWYEDKGKNIGSAHMEFWSFLFPEPLDKWVPASPKDQTALRLSLYNWLATESNICSVLFGGNEESQANLEALKWYSETQVVIFHSYWLI